MAHLKLRLKALFFDYLVILAYLVVLFVSSMGLYVIAFDEIPEYTETQSHWLSFLTTVLPIGVYFAFKEAKAPYRTFGKKRVGLRIDYKTNPLWGSVIRNTFKFLPWQLAHYGVIKGIFQNDFTLIRVMIPYGLSLALPLVYIGMVALRKDHRHLPDLLGGSHVVLEKEKEESP